MMNASKRGIEESFAMRTE